MTGRKPRLLCLVQLPPPVHGASVVNQQVISSDVIRASFDIDVLPLQFARSIEDITRFSLRKVAKALTTAVKLGVALHRDRPDAVYFTLSPVGGAFYRDCVFLALIKASAVRTVVHLHGKGIRDQLEPAWRRALYRWAFNDVAVIHLSPSLAADIADVVATDRMFFVPNGIARAETVTARVADDASLRVVYLSNMAEEKGALVLLEALGVLATRGADFTATFAGAPFGDCVPRFLARVEELRLGDRVRYVGPVYGAEKHRLLDEHDVLVFPTHYAREAFPLVVLEAMQHALPVITTTEGAIADMVVDGETGFLVPPRDPAALADRIEIVARDRERARRMGEHGRARYLDHYTLEHFETALSRVLTAAIRDVRA